MKIIAWINECELQDLASGVYACVEASPDDGTTEAGSVGTPEMAPYFAHDEPLVLLSEVRAEVESLRTVIGNRAANQLLSRFRPE